MMPFWAAGAFIVLAFISGSVFSYSKGFRYGYRVACGEGTSKERDRT